MSEPITRSICHGPDWGIVTEQVSVPWCETHKTPIHPDLKGRCLLTFHPAFDEEIDGKCKLLDSHAPTAVWRDTDG